MLGYHFLSEASGNSNTFGIFFLSVFSFLFIDLCNTQNSANLLLIIKIQNNITTNTSSVNKGTEIKMKKIQVKNQ